MSRDLALMVMGMTWGGGVICDHGYVMEGTKPPPPQPPTFTMLQYKAGVVGGGGGGGLFSLCVCGGGGGGSIETLGLLAVRLRIN